MVRGRSCMGAETKMPKLEWAAQTTSHQRCPFSDRVSILESAVSLRVVGIECGKWVNGCKGVCNSIKLGIEIHRVMDRRALL